jgi:hypothetical protein
MSEHERALLLRKLQGLVDCVMAQADKDPVFAGMLTRIFLNDENPERPISRAGGKQTRPTFNPVLFLKDHGEAALLRELESRTDDDLRAVLRFQGLRKGKELKKLKRPEMLRDIASGAQAKLKQGMVVAGVGEVVEVQNQPRTDARIDRPHAADDGDTEDH